MTHAERQRRYRLRQRAGITMVPAPVDNDALELMIAAGAISEDESLDNERVGAALVDLALRFAINNPVTDK